MTILRNCLKTFLNHFGATYGSDQRIANVHSLSHLPSHVRRFGVLDNFSSFPYENYLQTIKRLIRKRNYPLQQVIRRLSEQSKIVKHSKVHSTCTKKKGMVMVLSQERRRRQGR